MKDGQTGDRPQSEGEKKPRMSKSGQELLQSKPRSIFRRKESAPMSPRGGAPKLQIVPTPANRPPAQIGPDTNGDAWASLTRVPMVHPDPGPDVDSSFDMLRTRLSRMLAEQGWNRIAVASPTRGCGATFSAVNLALSFARLPSNRAVLMDLNQRRPSAAKMLGVRGHGDMRGFLAGLAPVQDHIVRLGDRLAAGFTQTPDPEAATLLHGDHAAVALGAMMDQLTPDILICDLPPVLECDDLLAILPQVDGVLLVADGYQTRPEHIDACERQLSGQTRVLGVALNQALRAGPAPAFA